jgi:hypothetical protein
MTVHTRLVAAVVIVSMGSLGTVLADFCQQDDGHYLGDVNGDAIIDMDDVRHLAQHELGHSARTRALGPPTSIWTGASPEPTWSS